MPTLAEVLQSPDWSALLVGRCPAAMRADFLRDRDFSEATAAECFTRPPFHWIDIHRFLGSGRGSGIGSGIGIGRGSGSGRGIGSGSGIGIGRGSGSGRGIGRGSGIGRGIGIGRGSGIGRGIGSGSGSGIGRGIGSGIGSGSAEIYPETAVMRIGQAYLVHLGDWHTFVGRVCDQLGPLTYEMEFASKVDIESQGDRWQELCAGNTEVRSAARFWHYGKVVVPLSIVAMEWHGDLPHPDAPKLRAVKKAK